MKHYLFSLIVFSLFACNSGSDQQAKNDPPKEEKVSKPADDDFATLEKKLESDSMNMDLRASLAAAYYAGGQPEKAASHYLKVYKQDKKNFQALVNLGNIYYDIHQDDHAIEFYEKALEMDPGNMNVKCDLATSYSNINKNKKAIQLLRDNIKVDAHHVKSHYNLSVILRKDGNAKEADQELEIYNSLTANQK